MVRSTTNGVLNNYRYNLQKSTLTRNKAQNTVLTQRTFNSFAEDPATASRCFQMRRSFLRTNSQYSVGDSVVKKYEAAWDTLDSVVSDVDNRREDSALAEIIYGSNAPTGSGRNSLGDSMVQIAKSIVQTMNNRYGDNYIFAGADGLNPPFALVENDDGTTTLTYRGVNVDAAVGSDDEAKLKYMSEKEKKFVDIGLGLKEENGQLRESSAFNVALQGINFLGYGTDGDGDPKNIVSIMNRMGEILQNCHPETGLFADGEEEEFRRLFTKFEDAADILSRKHVEMDTETEFLKSNQLQLEANAYTLQEHFLGIEDVDLAEAITSYSWAQFCYTAALQVGTSILSESLMDYLQF